MENNIIIKLGHSSDAHFFESEELIHRREYNEVIDWINTDIENIDKTKNEILTPFNRERSHNTITVLGTRGSGKTSFLLSVLKYFHSHRHVEVLKIFDPTLIEEKGHIFLNVLSLIKERVELELDKIETDLINPKSQNRMIWRKKLENLSEGLPSMDGVGVGLTEMSWQDPDYIMQRGMRTVSASRNLEDHFVALLETALLILKKEVFIIAFDDIDIDFKKGWPVLETIRKYFVSPKVITILSGDMRLYSLAVRKQQWLNFGRELIEQEGSQMTGGDYLSNLITETEGQYLQKVMKPSRRVHLSTVKEKIIRFGQAYINVQSGRNSKTPITETYNKIFNRFGIYNTYQAETFRSYLMNAPLRLQLRFLDAFHRPTQSISASSIIDPFISDLYEQRIDIGQLTSSPQFFNITILDLLLRHQILSETYQLQPTTTSAGLNGALTAMSFLASRNIEENPENIFDNFIRIGYIRNLLSSLGYNSTDGTNGNSLNIPSIEGLCRHSGLLQDKVLKDNVGLITSYITAFRDLNRNGDKPWSGIIPLKGLAGLGKQRKDLQIDRIDYVTRNISSIEKAIIFFPVTVSQSVVDQKGVVTYSFYTLLSVIAELIKKSNNQDVFKGIMELSQLRSYPKPDFKQKSSGGDDSSFDVDHEDQNIASTDGYLQFEKHVNNWVSSYPKTPIPSYLLGKISTRAFFAFDAIQKSQKRESLGAIMHSMVIAFLNAVFIEDVKERIERPEINLNNTRMSDDILNNNLSKYNSSQNQELYFSKWIFSCPLLLVYIETGSPVLRHIMSFIGEDRIHHYLEFSVHKTLKKISPKSRRIRPKNLDIVLKNFADMGVTLRDLENADSEIADFHSYLNLYNDKLPREFLTENKLKAILDYILSEEDNL